MRRQVYAFDRTVNTYRHMYVDHGPAQVAQLRGTALTPRNSELGSDNRGRKVIRGGAA